MKECNCGRIPPCYSGRVFNIYEEAKRVKHEWDKTQELWAAVKDKLRGKLMEGGFLDDTHNKVYELNRQMCDLDIPLRNPIKPIKPIKPLSEETAQELIGKWEEIGKEWASKKKEIVESIFGNITNEKSNIMKEKKTKKMTKAAAFEWLKNKKVYVGGNSGLIQEKLFEAGFEWPENKRHICHLEQPFLILSEGGGIFYSNDMCHYLERSHEETSAEDILSLEIEEECAKDDEDPYFGGRIKDLQEMIEDDEVLIITKTNFLTMTK